MLLFCRCFYWFQCLLTLRYHSTVVTMLLFCRLFLLVSVFAHSALPFHGGSYVVLSFFFYWFQCLLTLRYHSTAVLMLLFCRLLLLVSVFAHSALPFHGRSYVVVLSVAFIGFSVFSLCATIPRRFLCCCSVICFYWVQCLLTLRYHSTAVLMLLFCRLILLDSMFAHSALPFHGGSYVVVLSVAFNGFIVCSLCATIPRRFL